MTTSSLYLQNKIAVIWDFDKTLIPGHMQAPLFDYYRVDEQTFWKEANGYKDFFTQRGLVNWASDSYYLLHILTYVREGKFRGLNNGLLRELGKRLTLFPGLPGFFEALTHQVRQEPAFERLDIEVEHYIVSSGLREMIVGSPIGPLVKGIWACEFVDELPMPGYLNKPSQRPMAQRDIQAVGYEVDDTSKTRAVFEINKGPEFDVNDKVPEEARRIPFKNMIYIADGKSDVPVFSVVNKAGGRTFAVYDAGVRNAFREANDLLRQGRVHCIAPADYTEGSQAYLWITDAVHDIGQRIVSDWTRTVSQHVGRAPSYRGDSEISRAIVATQESVVADLRSAIDQPPLISLPRPVEPDAEYPAALVKACAQVSDRYQPITDDEMRQLATWVRGRAAARSEGGRRRGSATDLGAVAPAEIEARLDELRARPPRTA